MASKVLAQVLVYTTQVFTRAFVDAYRQAAANAAKGAGAAYTARAATDAAREAAKPDVKSSTVINGLSIGEARQILNVREHDTLEKILQHYEHLYKVNEKANGGSFYLQSKVVRAKEALEYEFKARQQQQQQQSA